MTIEDYQRLKNRYINLKSEVYSIADDLSDFSSNISSAKNIVKLK